MSNNNLVQQNDEVEVLGAIFGDKWVYSYVSNTYELEISQNLSLHITLHDRYPSDEAPKYELFAPYLSRRQKEVVADEFQRIFNENRGDPIIFQWIERLKAIAEEKTESIVSVKVPERFLIANPSEKCSKSKNVELNITHGPVIVDRKSTFQAHVCAVHSADDYKQFLEKLLSENRKLTQATHNISAFIVKLPNGVTLQDCNDDREKHAGGRLLHLLDMLDVTNVMVVVTRWYGGIHLGADRFKDYHNAARAALLQGGFIEK